MNGTISGARKITILCQNGHRNVKRQWLAGLAGPDCKMRHQIDSDAHNYEQVASVSLNQ